MNNKDGYYIDVNSVKHIIPYTTKHILFYSQKPIKIVCNKNLHKLECLYLGLKECILNDNLQKLYFSTELILEQLTLK